MAFASPSISPLASKQTGLTAEPAPRPPTTVVGHLGFHSITPESHADAPPWSERFMPTIGIAE
jgi:hypothetical protein